jgi:aryl carrier-like protein
MFSTAAMMTAIGQVTAGAVAYLGGSFTSVRNTTRNRAACVDATTGLLKAWNPNCNNEVVCMALSGDNLYLGGWFTSVRGETRNRAACVAADATSADPTLRAWNPDCNGSVNAMHLIAGNMYLGGNFTSVRGTSRNRAACVEATVIAADPTLRAWNPDCNGTVNAIENDSGGLIYLGGNFTSVRGTTRNYVASLDETITSENPTLHPWNPNCNGAVHCMRLGENLYIGGEFTTVNGETRNRAACLNLAGGTLAVRAWNPNCDDIVSAITGSGGDISLGGRFTSVRGTARNRAACVDVSATASNPTLRAWNPNCDSAVRTIVMSGSFTYLGGEFTAVDSTTRNRAACVDTTVGLLKAWNPNCNNTVHVITLGT